MQTVAQDFWQRRVMPDPQRAVLLAAAAVLLLAPALPRDALRAAVVTPVLLIAPGAALCRLVLTRLNGSAYAGASSVLSLAMLPLTALLLHLAGVPLTAWWYAVSASAVVVLLVAGSWHAGPRVPGFDRVMVGRAVLGGAALAATAIVLLLSHNLLPTGSPDRQHLKRLEPPERHAAIQR